jgi:hypothetical protein
MKSVLDYIQAKNELSEILSELTIYRKELQDSKEELVRLKNKA